MAKRSLRRAIEARKRRFNSESRPLYIGDMGDRRADAETMGQHATRRAKAAAVLLRAKKRFGSSKFTRSTGLSGHTTISVKGGKTRDTNMLGLALKRQKSKLQTLVQNSHSKGMAKVGRQKTDMSGGNQVNRPKSLGRTATGKREFAYGHIIARSNRSLAARHGQAKFDRMLSQGIQSSRTTAANNLANAIKAGKVRGIMRTGGTGLRGSQQTARGKRNPLMPVGMNEHSARVNRQKAIGMAGKKGPASASSVSAARKKAWVTRRKKFGKAGGKKRSK